MYSRLLPSALAALAAACVLVAPADAARRTCGTPGYSYAGFQAPASAFGVSGRLKLLATPQLSAGHVAAWLGVGGAGMGPNGADEWLQVGLAGFPDGHSELYYEFTGPGMKAPQYVSLGLVGAGEAHDVAVYERPSQPNAWRVMVDGTKVSPPIALPGSHGAWKPIATTESYDAGAPSCNRFSYDLSGLSVATQLGGGWQPFGLSRALLDQGYALTKRASGFAVASA